MALRLPRRARAAINRLGYAARRARPASVVDVAIFATLIPGHARHRGPDAHEVYKANLDHKTDHQYAKRRTVTQKMACDDHSHSEHTPATDDNAAHHHVPVSYTDDSAAHHHCDIIQLTSETSAERLLPSVDNFQWNVNAPIFSPALLQTDLLLQELAQVQTIAATCHHVAATHADDSAAHQHRDIIQLESETNAELIPTVDKSQRNLNAPIFAPALQQTDPSLPELGHNDVTAANHCDPMTHCVYTDHNEATQLQGIDNHINGVITPAADHADFIQHMSKTCDDRLTPTEGTADSKEFNDHVTYADSSDSTHLLQTRVGHLPDGGDAADAKVTILLNQELAYVHTPPSDEEDLCLTKPMKHSERPIPTRDTGYSYLHDDREADVRNQGGSDHQDSLTQLSTKMSTERMIPTEDSDDVYKHGDCKDTGRHMNCSDPGYRLHADVDGDHIQLKPQSRTEHATPTDDTADGHLYDTCRRRPHVRHRRPGTPPWSIRRSQESANDDSSDCASTPASDGDDFNLMEYTADGHLFDTCRRRPPVRHRRPWTPPPTAIQRSLASANDDSSGCMSTPAADDEDFNPMESIMHSERPIHTDTGVALVHGDDEANARNVDGSFLDGTWWASEANDMYLAGRIDDLTLHWDSPEQEPCALNIDAGGRVVMELAGAVYWATYVPGPPTALIWNDGDSWTREPDAAQDA